MVVSIPVDLIITSEALNDIWGTDLTIVEYARKKERLMRPRADPLYEQASDRKFALLELVVNAVRNGALKVVAIDSDGKRTTLTGINWAEYGADENLTKARLDVPYLRGRSKELTLGFERSNWRAWLAQFAAPPMRSSRRGRDPRGQDDVRKYVAKKYSSGERPGVAEVHRAMTADGQGRSLSTVGRGMGRRRDAYRGSNSRPKK